jgi:hypothetical protein
MCHPIPANIADIPSPFLHVGGTSINQPASMFFDQERTGNH